MAKSSASPRKQPGKKRAPARCTICPDRPLRKVCPHGQIQKTRTIARSENAVEKDSANTPILEAPSVNELCPPIADSPMPGPSDGAHTTSPHLPLIIRLPHFSNPTTPSRQPQGVLPFFYTTTLLPSSASTINSTSTRPTIQQPLDSEEADFTQQLDPSLHPNSAYAEGLENDAENTETDASPSKEKRRIPSATNAVHGFVDGVGRGNSACQIPRLRPLKKAILEQSKSTQRYRRLLQDLAEAMSEESGCWLYFASQHPYSSTPFTHFASKRFRLEAAPELDESHRFFSAIMSALLRASKRSKVEAEKARSIAEEKLAKIEAHTAVVENDLAKAQAEVEARDRLIASLLARNELTSDQMCT